MHCFTAIALSYWQIMKTGEYELEYCKSVISYNKDQEMNMSDVATSRLTRNASSIQTPNFNLIDKNGEKIAKGSAQIAAS